MDPSGKPLKVQRSLWPSTKTSAGLVGRVLLCSCYQSVADSTWVQSRIAARYGCAYACVVDNGMCVTCVVVNVVYKGMVYSNRLWHIIDICSVNNNYEVRKVFECSGCPIAHT